MSFEHVYLALALTIYYDNVHFNVFQVFVIITEDNENKPSTSTTIEKIIVIIKWKGSRPTKVKQ